MKGCGPRSGSPPPSRPQPSSGFFSKGELGTPSSLAQDEDMARTVYEKTAALIGIDVLPIPPLP
ncbi:hypothetical protein [Streptomyces sp. AA1529]|uniref:hypothetical protein n=1 Tax=Streptomyces sp. AA1529 TaxID=1203257 RepID=UPI003D7605D2